MSNMPKDPRNPAPRPERRLESAFWGAIALIAVTALGVMAGPTLHHAVVANPWRGAAAVAVLILSGLPFVRGVSGVGSIVGGLLLAAIVYEGPRAIAQHIVNMAGG